MFALKRVCGPLGRLKMEIAILGHLGAGAGAGAGQGLGRAGAGAGIGYLNLRKQSRDRAVIVASQFETTGP